MILLLPLILLAGAPKLAPAKPIQLMGRFTAAQACPISAERALSCAHVTDIRPFDSSVGLFALQWSDGAGREGVLQPVAMSGICDLALFSGQFGHSYELAQTPPAPGTRVRFAGYDWGSARRAYEARQWEAKVIRVVAGHLILDHAGEPGTSGACVLDEQDRVRGILCFGHVMENRDEIGIAVGVWGACVRELLGR